MAGLPVVLPVDVPGAPVVYPLLYPGQGQDHQQGHQPVEGEGQPVEEDVAHTATDRKYYRQYCTVLSQQEFPWLLHHVTCLFIY